MGLIHPTDLAAWQRWERSHHRLRQVKAAVKNRVRPHPEAPLHLHHTSDQPRVLVALDVARGTSVDALLAPLDHVAAPAAILTRGPLPAHLTRPGWTTRPLAGVEELPPSISTVLSAGSFEAVSLPVHRWASGRGVRFIVVQHGLLTPFAPPLPPGSTVAAWTEGDGEFWRSGRGDVDVVTVGSQLLWKAATDPVSAPADGPALFLGQLHGTELPRHSYARAAWDFCRREQALYRPHPAEVDVVSRAIHVVWRRAGITFDDSGVALRQRSQPVVSVFSTGILEAAARGLPAWGFHPSPPRWVEDLWRRVGIQRWGDAPTQAPAFAQEPARTIASQVG
ncbi:prephenate dehydrogenase [Aestuariimicrobium ganziense]|uniref:prephenate dehydrogenase n=1 Tax=Aestuariimicrobium ganziense TaxID=2773677 RepID=UPI0019424510|nr:prephenate dehydrogenase [Aestuariimicrobium ganziense]